jgi:hypothetical protein
MMRIARRVGPARAAQRKNVESLGGLYRRALGGGLDDLKADIERMKEVQCVNEANQSAAIRAIDAKWEDLSRNWKPTGFYRPSEVQTLITTISASNAQARLALASAPHSTSDAQQVINQAHAYLNRNDERALVYKNAVAAAAKSGTTAIDAPGLKDWVIKSMINISQAFVTVAVLECRSTWLDAAANVINAIWSTAKRIVGIAIKVGDTVLKAADDVLDLYPIVKWGALGVGALWVLNEIRKRRG